ncbi:spherulin 4-like cell surface protein [Thozetella sp. PMI_491]|nr:spherulin 4-like cell surface protein [Thozetella sp. PMI_491]
MTLAKIVPKRWRSSKWFFPALAFVTALVLIAIIVPLALVLPRQSSKTPSASVILPLYIYPIDNSSWSPVHQAVKLRPDIKFLIVINPHDGPGEGLVPNEEYHEAISFLSSYTNVQMLGYVRTGYATRNISDVTNEVAIYSGWASNSSSLAMSGIFLDEAPHQYTPDAVSFMKKVDQVVKNSPGLRGTRTIVHNPGTIPDPRFNETTQDITVVFEDDYTAWQERKAAVAALPIARSASSLMINAVPAMEKGALKDFVDSLTKISEHLFITTTSVDFYESFASGWLDFVGQVPS